MNRTGKRKQTCSFMIPGVMDHTMIYADSAGIILSVGITRKLTPEHIGKLYHDTGVNAPGGILWGGMDALEVYALRKLLDDLKDPDLYKSLNGKVGIGASTFFAKHIWSFEWEDNEDLLSCMMNSFHVPLLCRRNKKINGHEIVDGAYCVAGSDLPHGDRSLYVGDDPHADVSMTFSINQILYASLGENDCDYNAMIQAGYNAFIKWSGVMNKKVGQRKANRTVTALLWVLKCIELIIAFIRWALCLSASTRASQQIQTTVATPQGRGV